MTKKLSEMTLEELWELFPIFLTEHKPEWAEQYEQMESSLRKSLSNRNIIRISHIGSTAIPLIWAKPIVDVLVEIAPGEDMPTVSDIIADLGCIKMSDSESRISLNYGYTPKGFAEKVFHIHLRYKGDNDELYFRDYLNDNPDIAHEYEALKLDLWHKFEHDRDGYTSAKGDFINKYTLTAKNQYGNRY